MAKHSSRLKIAEIALSVLAWQCLGQLLPDLAKLRREVVDWELGRNATGRAIQRRLRRTVPRLERREAFAETEVVTADAAYLRAPIAIRPRALGQRHNHDKFAHDVIRCLGISK